TISFSPDYFHTPLESQPERWLPEAYREASSSKSNNARSRIEPFSIAPRSCIGRPLVLAQLRLVLAKMVWKFDIEKANTKAGGLQWEEQKTFTVVEKLPFDVKLTLAMR
ncbi:uncharacterized protein BDR25DRAFT_207093, partial [Lindgomyces ingoldianus]